MALCSSMALRMLARSSSTGLSQQLLGLRCMSNGVSVRVSVAWRGVRRYRDVERVNPHASEQDLLGSPCTHIFLLCTGSSPWCALSDSACRVSRCVRTWEKPLRALLPCFCPCFCCGVRMYQFKTHLSINAPTFLCSKFSKHADLAEKLRFAPLHAN